MEEEFEEIDEEEILEEDCKGEKRNETPESPERSRWEVNNPPLEDEEARASSSQPKGRRK